MHSINRIYWKWKAFFQNIRITYVECQMDGKIK